MYLLLDEQEISDAGPRAGLPPEEVISSLASAVQSSMWLKRPSNMFGWFSRQISLWRRDVKLVPPGEDIPPPPVIALLCIFSEAAKDMGASGMNASDFYGPLAQLLGLNLGSDDRTRQALGNSYRHIVESAWDCMEEWCSYYDGQRGEISVFSATSAEYVGLALSQALIRKSDRRHLPEFFRQYRFEPTGTTSHVEMHNALDDWIRSPYSSAGTNLRTIWRHEAVRSRVIDIVTRELQQWSGARTALGGQPRLSLAATVRRMPTTRLHWLLVVQNSLSEESVESSISIDGDEQVVTMHPTLDGELSLSLGPDEIGPMRSAVSTALKLKTPEGEYVARQPKRLTILGKDPLSSLFMERVHIKLGQESIVATRNAIDSEAVRGLLSRHADDRWREVPLSPQQSDGGSAFIGVRVINQGFVPAFEWLNPLSPKEEATLAFEGGLSLGRNAWLQHLPPRVIPTVTGNAPFTLRLLDIDNKSRPLEITNAFADPSASPAELLTGCLTPGRYRVELVTDDRQEIVKAAHIRLVTNDTIDIRAWRKSARLVRDFSRNGPLAAVAASSPHSGTVDYVEGLRSKGSSQKDLTCSPSKTIPAWWQDKTKVLQNRDKQNNIVTGASWVDAVEGLMYLGGGTAETLTSIARQVAPSEEYASWRFWRACSDLGHIEVSLDELYRPKTWRIVRPQLAETTDGHWYLCGYWPRSLIATFGAELPNSLEFRTSQHGPNSTLIRNREQWELEKVLANTGLEVTVVPHAARDLSLTLPYLHELVAAMPATTLPIFDGLKRFDVEKQVFTTVNEFSHPGTYRVQARNMRSTVIVTEDDLDKRRCRHADIDLAKHVAASMIGRPYLAFSEGHRVLATPNHIRLPFLFGRVATACSGTLSYSRNASWTVYEGVTPDIAGVLMDRLTWRRA